MIKPLKSLTLKNDNGDDITYTLSGEYPDLTAGAAEQIISDDFTENKVPYLLRASGGNGSKREEDTLVGGTVAWNQTAPKGGGLPNVSTRQYDAVTGITTITPANYNTDNVGLYSLNNSARIVGHKYYVSADVYADYAVKIKMGFNVTAIKQNISAATWTRIDGVQSYASASLTVYAAMNSAGWASGTFKIRNVMCFDLTQMFGSTIADYIYSLEQATAGAGVAWFKALFPNDYYAYNAGELKSVEGVSAHLMKDADDNVVGNYPLDDSLTLRGIPKLDANNSLYYVGDTYESDGTVTRKYGIVDMGTLTWSVYTSGDNSAFYASLSDARLSTSGDKPDFICGKYEGVNAASRPSYMGSGADKTIIHINNSTAFYVKDSAYSDAAAFKTAMSGVYFVYELATSTTETADPYTNPQNVDPDGTEEYVSTSIVPVGHETKYFADLVDRLAAIPAPPTANGTYRLIATVTGGVATLSWTNN